MTSPAASRLTRQTHRPGMAENGDAEPKRARWSRSRPSPQTCDLPNAILGDELGDPASCAYIALTWLLQKQPVTAPIVGATKTQHLDDAVGALATTLSMEEVASLEAPYVPHAVTSRKLG